MYFEELLMCAEEQGFINLNITYVAMLDIITVTEFSQLLLKLTTILDKELWEIKNG